MNYAQVRMLIALLFLNLVGCVAAAKPVAAKPAGAIAPTPMDAIKAGLAYRDNPVVRAEAVEALESLASPETLPWVRSALLDDHAGVRFAACMVLGKVQDSGATSMIRKCLTDKNESVRVAVIYALHRLGQTEFTERLPNYVLTHPDPVVRRNAAIAISMLGQPSAITVLARAMKDPDPGVRNHALEGMARLGNKEAARELTFLANSGIGSDEVFAINALAGTNDPIYEDAFRYKLINGSHLETRLAAARALGRLRIDAGLPVVLDALKPTLAVRAEPGDPPVEQTLRIRQLACAAAGAIGSPRAVPALETLLRDSVDPRVQISAARALLEISQKRDAVSSPFQPTTGNR